jgi:peptidoglycan-associated lipoprotein
LQTIALARGCQRAGLRLAGAALAAALVAGCALPASAAPGAPPQQGARRAHAQVPAPQAGSVLPPDDVAQRRIARVGASIHFESNQSEVDDEQSDAVIAHAQLARDDPEDDLVVQGHCDERGGRAYNLALGQRRAAAVKRKLVLLGVAEARIVTVSFGRDQPRAPCHEERCWAQNRRAEIVHARR